MKGGSYVFGCPYPTAKASCQALPRMPDGLRKHPISCGFFLLDIQLRFSYIQLTPKRVFIKKSKLGYTTEGLYQTLVRVWLRV
jgi:hypothetical protein